MKAFAILCVAFAHCSYLEQSKQFFSSWVGINGVPIFLILSGYFFNTETEWKKFIINKTRSIVVPWVVWAFFTYLFSLFLGRHSFSTLRLILWTIGHGTWLYFVPVLLVLMVTTKLWNSKTALITYTIIGIISITLYCIGILNPDGTVTFYQNPLNWILFFAIGQLMRTYKIRLPQPNTGIFLFLSILFISLAVLLITFFGSASKTPNNWSPLAIPIEIVVAVAVCFLSIAFSGSKALVNVGKNTYFIYFLHMQFGIGVVSRMLRISCLENIGWCEVVIRPILVVCVTYLLMLCFIWISKMMHKKSLLWIVGVRCR